MPCKFCFLLKASLKPHPVWLPGLRAFLLACPLSCLLCKIPSYGLKDIFLFPTLVIMSIIASHLLKIFLSKFLQDKTPGLVSVLLYRNCQTVFWSAVLFCFLTNNICEFQLLHNLTSVWYCLVDLYCFLVLAILLGMERYLIVVFAFIWWLVNEHL